MPKKIAQKLERIAVFGLRNLINPFSMRRSTQLMTWYYAKRGMVIEGKPNYLSAKIWFDGTSYDMIELGEGCTISSFVRILTHDWSPYTIGRGMGMAFEKPFGVFRGVKVGRFAFVGTCSVLMPGAEIGEGAVVGAGSVVRGKVEPWTIVTGSPAEPVGDSRAYLRRQLERAGEHGLLEQFDRCIARLQAEQDQARREAIA